MCDDNPKSQHQSPSDDGQHGIKLVEPQQHAKWEPGMPAHWIEQTTGSKWLSILRRVLYVSQFIATVAYLQFRARRTIGIFDRSRVAPYLAYQVFFFVMECLCAIPILIQLLQVWNVCKRNCIDYKRIPQDLIKPYSASNFVDQLESGPSACPSIGIYIPCYNEEARLVQQTILGALQIDYPYHRLNVYLCDDGQDVQKERMISQLRNRYSNVFYITRPDHNHAKAGNLNYAIQRTQSDLVVTLDADFIPRPNLVQRLLSYYYVRNPETGLYEFNETLAVVQTPQHFRNLSPHDSDPLDQRSLLFFDVIQPGKDWFNASTMVGTNNLISRAALKEANYYPTYSITEDSAMSLKFHSLGYRTYFVNESVATGLATTSLHSNLRQRARWMRGDWQILFSKNGPFAVKGLSFIQRLLYLNMGLGRLMSFVFMFYDLAAVTLLVFGITPLDVQHPIEFIVYLSIFMTFSSLSQFALTAGGRGLHKCAAANMAFETIFRYDTMKGLLLFMFRGQNLKFKVTEKPAATGAADKEMTDEEDVYSSETEDDTQGTGSNADQTTSECRSHSEVGTASDETQVAANSMKLKAAHEAVRNGRRKEVGKNLRRIWFNILMAMLLTFTITWGVVKPPAIDTTVDGSTSVSPATHFAPLMLALAFAAASLLPHLLAIYLCFPRYVRGWMLEDVACGRCDQFAVHGKSGRLYVPWSYISLLTVARGILLCGGVVAVLVYYVRQETRLL